MTRRVGIVIVVAVMAAAGVAGAGDQERECCFEKPGTASSEECPRATEGAGTRGPIALYQRYISPVDGDRCPMSPTCSEYFRESAQKHGPIVGFVMACERLMRCGRDELSLSPTIRVQGEKKCYDPVANNDFWWARQNHPDRQDS